MADEKPKPSILSRGNPDGTWTPIAEVKPMAQPPIGPTDEELLASIPKPLTEEELDKLDKLHRHGLLVTLIDSTEGKDIVPRLVAEVRRLRANAEDSERFSDDLLRNRNGFDGPNPKHPPDCSYCNRP